eukprot:gene6861-7575_t
MAENESDDGINIIHTQDVASDVGDHCQNDIGGKKKHSRSQRGRRGRRNNSVKMESNQESKIDDMSLKDLSTQSTSISNSSHSCPDLNVHKTTKCHTASSNAEFCTKSSDLSKDLTANMVESMKYSEASDLPNTLDSNQKFSADADAVAKMYSKISSEASVHRRPRKKNPNAPKVRPSVLVHPGSCGPAEKLKPPKRKPGNNKKYLKVLPTGMLSATADAWRQHQELSPLRKSDREYYQYEGIFDGFSVQITREPDIFWLHYQGTLSKSEPCYRREIRDIAVGRTERATVLEKKVLRKQRRIEQNEKRKQRKEAQNVNISQIKYGLYRQGASSNKEETLSVNQVATSESQQQEGLHLEGSITDASSFSNEHPVAKRSKVKETNDANLPNECGSGAITDNAQEESEHQRNHNVMEWADVCIDDIPPELKSKRTIHAVKEALQLSLVEAFYLIHTLGCLRILDEQGNELSALQCWHAFLEAQPRFLQRYVVYHHLRSCGWVPKSGLKFAVDFLAYRQGPAYYHSSFSVSVCTAWEDTLEPWGVPERQMPWHTLSNIIRMSNQAGKEPVLCHVVRPRTLTDADIETPACLEQFKVMQLLPRRWIPEHTRTASS